MAHAGGVVRGSADALADLVANYVVVAEAYYMITCRCENQTNHVVLRPFLSQWSRRSMGCSQETHRLFQIILKTVHNLLFADLVSKAFNDLRGVYKRRVLPSRANAPLPVRRRLPILNRPLIRERAP